MSLLHRVTLYTQDFGAPCGMTPSARSEERSTNTLILFAQPFDWDASKPKQPREVPQQGVGSPPALTSARVTGRAEPPVSL